MSTHKSYLTACAAAFLLVSPASAIVADKEYPVMNEDMGVPVFPYDIEDRPYVIVAGIEAGIRKPTIFSKAASQKKIYKELWERGEKTDADAIVLASYGDSKVSAFSWGRTGAKGIAIRFLTDEEIANGVQPEKAADFDPAKHRLID